MKFKLSLISSILFINSCSSYSPININSDHSSYSQQDKLYIERLTHRPNYLLNGTLDCVDIFYSEGKKPQVSFQDDYIKDMGDFFYIYIPLINDNPIKSPKLTLHNNVKNRYFNSGFKGEILFTKADHYHYQVYNDFNKSRTVYYCQDHVKGDDGVGYTKFLKSNLPKN